MCIPIIYGSVVICFQSLLFWKQVNLNNRVLLSFVCKVFFWSKNLKNKKAVHAKFSICVSYVEAVIYLLLHNFHDCNFHNYLNCYF